MRLRSITSIDAKRSTIILCPYYSTVLQRLLGGESPPNKVQELKSDALESLQILHRDEGMVMYAPPLGSNEKKTIYEIVIHRPYTDNTNTSYR